MKRTTVYLDEEQIKKLKEKGINISDLVRDKMSDVLKEGKELEEVLEYYKKLKEKIESNIEQLEKIKRDRDAEQDIRLKKLIEKCKDVPEIENLSRQFLEDSQQMMKLVDLIREKYPDIRISIADVREYYKLKNL